MIVIKIFQFVGQVCAFWIVWKGLDLTFLKWNENKNCNNCLEKDNQIQQIEIQNRKLLSENQKIKQESSEKDFDERLVKMLNLASTNNLKEIHGVGPVRANYIARKRPFKNMEEVRAELPSWVIDEARTWGYWKLKESKDGHSNLPTGT